MNKTDIVVIDDDNGILWLMEEILKEKYSYKTCKSGLTGLKCIEENQPSLVILDFKLGGGMNGLDVAKRIPEKCSETSIVFITGYKNSVIEHLDPHLPVIKVIEKPFDVKDLLDTINEILNRNLKKSLLI